MSEVNEWAVIERATLIVVNTVMWDGVVYSPETLTGWAVSDGIIMVNIDGVDCESGDNYDLKTEKFTNNSVKEETETHKTNACMMNAKP